MTNNIDPDNSEIYQVIERHSHAWNLLDAEGLASLFTVDCELIDHTLGRHLHGQRAIAELVHETRSLSPNFWLKPIRIFCGSSFAHIEVEMGGNLISDFMSASGIGQVWCVPMSSLMLFEGALIRQQVDMWNLVSMLSQLGAKLLPKDIYA